MRRIYFTKSIVYIYTLRSRVDEHMKFVVSLPLNYESHDRQWQDFQVAARLPSHCTNTCRMTTIILVLKDQNETTIKLCQVATLFSLLSTPKKKNPDTYNMVLGCPIHFIGVPNSCIEFTFIVHNLQGC